MNSKENYNYLKQASFSFFCKYELMKLQLGKRKLRLNFCNFWDFIQKLKIKLQYAIQMQMFPMLSFHFSNSSKITMHLNATILEYAWIIRL